MLAKHLPAILSAVGAMLTAAGIVGGGIFAFGQQLGDAQATARYWREYHEGVAKGCR